MWVPTYRSQEICHALLLLAPRFVNEWKNKEAKEREDEKKSLNTAAVVFVVVLHVSNFINEINEKKLLREHWERKFYDTIVAVILTSPLL